jgi:hypothetical protein
MYPYKNFMSENIDIWCLRADIRPKLIIFGLGIKNFFGISNPKIEKILPNKFLDIFKNYSGIPLHVTVVPRDTSWYYVVPRGTTGKKSNFIFYFFYHT